LLIVLTRPQPWRILRPLGMSQADRGVMEVLMVAGSWVAAVGVSLLLVRLM